MSANKQGLWILGSSGIAGVSQFVIYFLIAFYGNAEALGILAIINIVLSIVFLFQDMGLANYFIHKQDLSTQQKSALHFINQGLGAVAGLVMLLLAYPVSLFYDEPLIFSYLLITSINFLLLGVGAQYQAHFIKAGYNIELSQIDIVAKLILLGSTFMFIQLETPVVLSYIYAIITASAVRVGLMLLRARSDWHPSRSADWSIAIPALKFGSYQMGSQVINQIKTQLDQLVIGKLLGLEALGVYAFAKEMVLQPVKFVRPLIARMFFPSIAKLQFDEVRFTTYLNDFLFKISLLNLSIYLLLFAGLLFTSQFMGLDKYAQFLPIFSILIIIGLLRPMGTILGMAIQAKGQVHYEFYWNLITSIVSCVTVIIVAFLGDIFTFSYAMAALQLLLTVCAVMFFGRCGAKCTVKTTVSVIAINLFAYAIINLIVQS
ncbi:oligosaccharide flippase family protein [Pseudoalteromonas sp. T1lg23B]|uniref:oligosaccharide flippase family protein n=1 Tax=Pseudoalteromonas sp. T1lg23B TaxID=2077097 RepID=UPI000CF667A6|nr:oligosaccharide flippase family protein [Pseudoalteromonas sp. T1lg23B]